MALDINSKLSSIIQQIIARRPNISTYPGSAVSDIFAVPLSTELTKLDQFILLISKLQSLDLTLAAQTDTVFIADTAEALNVTESEVSNILTTGITRFASNFGITRKPATLTAGLVYYGRYSTNPLAPGEQITVPLGAVATSVTGARYRTIESKTMYAETASLDPDLNAYVIAVNVEAEVPGSSGNTSAYTVVTQTTSTDFDFVTNKSDFTSGTDEETDAALVDRVKSVFTGNNQSTLEGWKNLILSKTNAIDCYVAGAADPLLLRDPGYGGYIDIYVTPKNVIEKSEIKTFRPGDTSYPLSYKPVERIVLVEGTSGGSAYTFIQGTDYILDKDVNIVTRNSYIEDSAIQFINPVKLPDDHTEFTIVYEVDDIVNAITTILDVDQYKVPGVDVLIRQADAVTCEMSIRITIFPAFNREDTINSVKTAVQVYVASLGLGKNVQQSDVIAAVEAVPGVDRVVLPISKFNEVGEATVADYITIEGHQYASLPAANLTVST